MKCAASSLPIEETWTGFPKNVIDAGRRGASIGSRGPLETPWQIG
jgi:hypothetical protein